MTTIPTIPEPADEAVPRGAALVLTRTAEYLTHAPSFETYGLFFVSSEDEILFFPWCAVVKVTFLAPAPQAEAAP